MSFIAAVLILNLEEAEAFITFANLLNKPCQMVFFRVDHEMVKIYRLYLFTPLLHLFFVLPPPLLLPASFSSLASPPVIFLNSVTPPPYCHLFLTFSSPPPPSDAEVF